MPDTVSTIQSDGAALLHDLAKRQAHFSYGVIFVLVMILGIGSFFGYRAMQTYEKVLAQAEQQAEQYKKERDTDRAQFVADQVQRDTASKQQQVVVKVVHDRDTTTDKQIAAVSGVTTQLDALSHLSEAYKGQADFSAVPSTDTGVLFTVPQVNLFTTTKLDRERYFQDWNDTRNLFQLEQQKTASLSTDLQTSKNQAQDSEALAKRWENAAHKTKMRRFVDALERAGEIGGAAFVGYEMGKQSTPGLVVRP